MRGVGMFLREKVSLLHRSKFVAWLTPGNSRQTLTIAHSLSPEATPPFSSTTEYYRGVGQCGAAGGVMCRPWHGNTRPKNWPIHQKLHNVMEVIHYRKKDAFFFFVVICRFFVI